jgi:type I restriction enzyme S subunit
LRLTDLQNDHESLRVGLVKQAGMITSAYLGLRVNRKKLDSRYLYYLLHTYDTAKVFYGMGGGVRQSIGYEALKYLPILVPSINTQEKISNFLEDRTRILDKTLELINLQINKLNEYRAALITRNISKKFPVKKLKYIADINQKTLPENTDPDFEFEYVDIGNIDGTGKIQPPQLYRFADAPSRARRLAEEGDVVISTVRTYLKAIAKITHKNRPRVFSTGFAVLHPRQINGDYLFWALQSEDFLAEVMANSIGVNYPGIGEYRLGSLPIAVPSRSRQTAIAKLLDERCGKINRSVEIFQSQRQLVESYRSSLINAAVTGKIKI